jgi:hypothetical protein
MKKIIYGALGIVFAMVAISCDDDDDKDQVLEQAELPEPARNFVELHFPQQTINYTARDEDDYRVTLDNGIAIEFNLDGSWDEVKGNGVEFPVSLIESLPESLLGYLSTNYSGIEIIRLEMDQGNYEIELSNRLELIFDIDGSFVRLDD